MPEPKDNRVSDREYGSKTKSADMEDFFGEGVEPSTPYPEMQQPEIKSKNNEVVNATKPEPKPEPEPEPEPESTDESESEEEKKVEDKKPEPGPDDEVVEIDEDEYQYLTNLPYDDLIAHYTKHKKMRAASDSRLAKVEKIVTKDFVDAATKGEIPPELNRVFKDLSDESFQRHLGEFYETHRHNGDGWERIDNGQAVNMDILEEHTKLLTEKSRLSVDEYLPEGADFDYNEAVRAPSSVSGQALEKMNNRKAEIESRLSEIRNAAAKTQPNIDSAAQAEATRKHFEAFMDQKEDLKDSRKRDAFRNYVQDHLNNAIEVYYTAWNNQAQKQDTTRKLVLREINTVKKNAKAPAEPSKARTSNGKTPGANYNKSQKELIEADNSYFGDASPV